MLQLAYMLLDYLCAAAFWLAAGRAGWVGTVRGRCAAASIAALALAIPAGALIAAAGFRPAAWLVFVITIPFMSAIMPDVLGLVLLGHGLFAFAAPRRTVPELVGAR